MLKHFIAKTSGLVLISATVIATVAHAQVPPPAPPVVTSQLRQRLRAEILRTARATEPQYSNTRPTLALSVAQLGDWQTALRWTTKENDLNSSNDTNNLWYWRATQLARSGKWNEVASAAAHLSAPDVRADPLLFAARQMIDRGVRLHTTTHESRQLEEILNVAAPLLTSAAPDQAAYRAYLYARGGDVAASRRIFARALERAEQADARARNEAKTKYERADFFTADNVRLVLRWQVASGLLSDTVRYAKTHLDSADDISLGWWIAAARNSSELENLSELVAQLPINKRVLGMFELVISNAKLGYRERARAQFQQARQLIPEILATDKSKFLAPDKQRNAVLQDRAYFIYPAFLAALAMKDGELVAQTEAELREIAETAPAEFKLAELPLLAPAFELRAPQMLGKPAPTATRLSEISAQLRAAPPSEMQFNTLETLAAYFYGLKNNGELLKVSQAMLETARALQSAERAKRAAEKDSMFNPYWPQSPRVLTSIFWLQRAGDQQTAAQFARGFAQNVPARERPYAALALTQLGFFGLADRVFDPSIEIPLAQARDRARAREYERTHKFNVDWSEFTSWGEFAATQARFRAPDAPFRWIGKIENPDNRANVLSAWTSALFPVAPLQAPYVSRSPGGSSSAIGGYAGASAGG